MAVMQREHLELNGKIVNVFVQDPHAKTVFLLTFADAESCIYDLVKRCTDVPFNLIQLVVPDWDNSLSPWPHTAIFHGGNGYQGNAEQFIKEIVLDIYPQVKERFSLDPISLAIGGYSLAGLCSLYAGFLTDCFDAILCVTGSLWFSRFPQFVESHDLSPKIRYIDMSLGDKEPENYNLYMRNIGPNTTQILNALENKGVDVCFVWVPGKHLFQTNERQAAAIARYLEK